ncbi:MAG: phosphate acyltransferase [Actinomycetota bacterium]|nr:phosphate acyltransferase [Actinomycetota bacterium]
MNGRSAGVAKDWYQRSILSPPKVVLADLGDSRADMAAERLQAEGLAVVIEPQVDVSDPEVAEAVARASAAGLDPADPVVATAVLVASDKADAGVAGATRPTAEVVRAGLKVIGLTSEGSLLSSCFLLVLPGGQPIAYGDCGVVPDPNSEQLSAIAQATASTFERLTGDAARVALLSFSTKGSASHPRVDKVRQAVEHLAETSPGLIADGEMQFDAAWVPQVAEIKAPESKVAGQANVFVFPDLDSANIAYKITERLGGARAYGPLLQGLQGVLHDLSRGASADDIVDVAVIAGLMAQA